MIRFSPTLTSVLWHLMEEGIATVEELAKLTGWEFETIRRGIGQGTTKTFVRRADEPRSSPAVYALTALGKEQAVTIERAHVAFAARSQLAVTADEKSAVSETVERATIPYGLKLGPITIKEVRDTPALPPGPIVRMTVADDDFVCMVDTNGVVVVNLSDTEAVMFPAKAALKLQRVLGDIKFLERVAEGSL